ncbi:MAG: flagellar biosynthesis protein FlhF [Treponema sp.]|jgi:flagellar biosynthesis protein FlhF|nr:flagellar biosynthesis protein FlhF [Treponema sp.]
MVQFIEQAYDMDECLDKIRAKYGERFTILSHKTIRLGGFLGLFTREGIEVSGYIPNRYEKTSSGLMTFQGMNLPGMNYAVTGTSGPAPVSREAAPRNETLVFEEEKRKIMASQGKDLTMQQVLSTVQEIKEKIDQAAPAAQEGLGQEHPNIKRLRECFELNDFSSGYQEKIIARIKKECPLDTLEDYDALQDTVLEWIGESINIFREKPFSGGSPRIMVLVGPTGVGKTTTIAKLAAVFSGLSSSGKPARSVRMITIDSLRIGAHSQIEAYGEIMRIPVDYVKSQEELRKAIALATGGADIILIDTFGKSPRDAVKLGEMKHILDACGSRAEVHLTLMAATKTSDIQDILRQFEIFGYQSVIITKMDETIRMGNVISVLAEKGKSVSYITTGQTVPTDIQRAEVVRFLCNLEGFRVNRPKIEARFPLEEEEIQWR